MAVDLRTAALWLHELYEALVAAGFDEHDAINMVAQRLPLPPDLDGGA